MSQCYLAQIKANTGTLVPVMMISGPPPPKLTRQYDLSEWRSIFATDDV